LAQQKQPDFLDRFADGLERASERMKAVDSSPEYQRQKRLGKIRAKWLLLCFLIAVPIMLLSLWICEWFGWPKQIYIGVVSMIGLAGFQIVGNSLANKAIKRDGLSE
jgi:hypothetical protein